MLTGYPELVAWGVYAGALTEAEAAALRRSSRDDPGGAHAAFRRSLRMRDDLDDVFRALATDGSPSPPAVARLRDDEADALGHARLERGSAFAWTWRDDSALRLSIRLQR